MSTNHYSSYFRRAPANAPPHKRDFRIVEQNRMVRNGTLNEG